MKAIKIIVRGNEIKFYPKGNKNGYIYEMPNGLGFYTKDLFFYYGKPTIKNAVEVATNYIECLPFRKRIFDSFFR